jgi:hypothetical protein
MPTIAERVAKGVEFLDSRIPGWWEKRRIDLDVLDLSRPCLCVVGQLSPEREFGEAIDAGWLDLTFDAAYEYGLTAVKPKHFISGPHADEIYRDLDNEWRRVITARREATA